MLVQGPGAALGVLRAPYLQTGHVSFCPEPFQLLRRRRAMMTPSEAPEAR